MTLTPIRPATTSTRDGLVALLRDRVPGRPLPGPFYTDPQIFTADLEHIFGAQWFFAAAAAEVPEPGDYLTLELGPRSVIVIRDDDGELRAFHNVCRHRGSRVLSEPSGFVGNLVCPYHSWAYGIDGRLLHAPGLPPGTDPGGLGLRPVAIRVIAGLVFLCLAEHPPADIDTFADRLTPYLAPHRLTQARVAAREHLVEAGNWKLVMENNRECYHCDGHPELSCSFFLTYGMTADQVPDRLRPVHARFERAQADLQARCAALSLPEALVEDLAAPHLAHRIAREPLDGAGESLSLSGRALVTRPLSDLGESRLGRLSIHVQPNAWIHVMADHAVTFAVLPSGPGRSVLRTTWLVHTDAVEGVHFVPEELTHVWRQTNAQDSAFVALAQAGVADPAYEPGPYTTSEYQVEEFIRWYIARMLEGLT